VAQENLLDPPQFILLREAGILTEYSAVLPDGHHLYADPLIFFTGMKKKHYDYHS